VHDLEDGIAAGLVPVERLADPGERDALCAVAADLYVDQDPDALREVLDELLSLTVWPTTYAGTARDQAALKGTTSALIGRFCRGALEATSGQRPLRRYDTDLRVPERIRAECGLLKAVAAHYVMNRPGVHAVQDRERQLLTELVDRLADRAPDVLEPARAADWASAADDASRLRAVVDQVASLTDAAAMALHARLQPGG
jgi:dGTPase